MPGIFKWISLKTWLHLPRANIKENGKMKQHSVRLNLSPFIATFVKRAKCQTALSLFVLHISYRKKPPKTSTDEWNRYVSINHMKKCVSWIVLTQDGCKRENADEAFEKWGEAVGAKKKAKRGRNKINLGSNWGKRGGRQRGEVLGCGGREREERWGEEAGSCRVWCGWG